jgi:uncharacterized protein (DUF983 family)
MKKESKLYSVINQKCPVCHEGDMFTSPVFSKHFMEMNSTCLVCGFDLVQEPSYYFGAMYVSYAIQVAVFLLVYIVLRATIDPGTWTYVIWMIVASILVLPWNFRVSRAGWISLFFSYKKKALE